MRHSGQIHSQAVVVEVYEGVHLADIAYDVPAIIPLAQDSSKQNHFKYIPPYGAGTLTRVMSPNA